MTHDVIGWRQDAAADVYPGGPPTPLIARVGCWGWRMGKE
jgi:hypothetical protein